MRRSWILWGAFAAIVGVAFAYRGAQALLATGIARARPIEAGQREIAFLYPATSSESWERLTSALDHLRDEWVQSHPDRPPFFISTEHAFLEESAGVPEIAIWFQGLEDQKLWIRWYKLGGEVDAPRWFAEFQKRGKPPLAIIGSDTSHRFLQQARALQKIRDHWKADAPLLLATTATAERYDPRDTPDGFLAEELMQVYPERTFRFCFTNSYMAQAVVEFCQKHPTMWEDFDGSPTTLASIVSIGNSYTAFAMSAAAGHWQPYSLYALSWNDDLYSQDLAERFSRVFLDAFYDGDFDAALPFSLNNHIDYSVGDFYQANPSEELTLELYLAQSNRFRQTHQMLVLPTGAQRARRFLRTLCRRAPLEVRNIVAVSGDSITLNTVYRDREVAWNVLDLPVPLVFFSHRNPIDTKAGFGKQTTSTQDLLLYRDILESMLLASFTGKAWINDTGMVRQRLAALEWGPGRVEEKGLRPLFDAEGNRKPQTGEHVVWLHPALEKGRNLSQATISVWSHRGSGWRLAGSPLTVQYNRGQ